MELKEDQISEFHEWEKIDAEKKREEVKMVKDVQQVLDQNSKGVWNEMRTALLKLEVPKKSKISNENVEDQKCDDDRKERMNFGEFKYQARIIENKSPYKVFVAIDLGVDSVKMVMYWIRIKGALTKQKVVVDTKTAILLDGDGKFVAFGDEAIDSLSCCVVS